MTTEKEQPTTIVTLPERINVGRSRLLNTRIVQNFLLVWLDANIGDINNDDCRNSITKLREVVNTIYTFIDADECIDFISEIQAEKVLMIVSGGFGQSVVPVVHNMPQLVAIYVFCGNIGGNENWTSHWLKIKGVFTDIMLICEALRGAAQNCDQNAVSISFVQTTDRLNQDQLDPSFMYTQILKEILLTIDFEQKHINEFLTYCREQFVDNTTELDNVNKILTEYRRHPPIWWYTYPCFLYSMLNRALRLMEVDLIIKMGFFLRDLHNNIAQLHAVQYGERRHSKSFTVYRGQVLSRTDFDQLKKTQGGLLSCNGFFSTSRDNNVALLFVAESAAINPDLVGMLFIMEIDPLTSTACFANVTNCSYYQREEEILISMQSIFRIGQIKQVDKNERFWQVNLTLTSDNDSELRALGHRIREETFSSPTGWDRLGQLLLKMGESNRAQQVYETLLDQVSNETEKAHIHNQLGIIKYDQGKYEEGMEFYENSVAIYQKTLPPNHPSLATSYSNIGAVYQNLGEYSKALSWYEKANAIKQQSIPPNHPGLAPSYNNIGAVYSNMGDYPKALLYHEKALAIRQQSLPPNHPDLSGSYSNIGGVYDSMGEYLKALSCLEKALAIKQKSLPPNHPRLASTYSNIGLLYHKMGDYSKALSSLNKAIQIYEQTLPPNHLDLAIPYNNIALVYDNMGEYSEALLYHEKALKIRRHSLRPDHHDLGISFNNIGLVHDKLDDCPKALSYYEQALKIYRKALPPNHPHLGASFNNMGEVYYKMEKYLEAHSFYERALAILQSSLPANHPDIQTLKENIDKTKKKL